MHFQNREKRGGLSEKERGCEKERKQEIKRESKREREKAREKDEGVREEEKKEQKTSNTFFTLDTNATRVWHLNDMILDCVNYNNMKTRCKSVHYGH